MGTIHGIDAYTATMRQFFAGLPDAEAIEQDAAQDGDVTMRLVVRGTHTAALWGIAPTGNRVAWDVIMIYHLSNGTIAEQRPAEDWTLADSSDHPVESDTQKARSDGVRRQGLEPRTRGLRARARRCCKRPCRSAGAGTRRCVGWRIEPDRGELRPELRPRAGEDCPSSAVSSYPHGLAGRRPGTGAKRPHARHERPAGPRRSAAEPRLTDGKKVLTDTSRSHQP